MWLRARGGSRRSPTSAPCSLTGTAAGLRWVTSLTSQAWSGGAGSFVAWVTRTRSTTWTECSRGGVRRSSPDVHIARRVATSVHCAASSAVRDVDSRHRLMGASVVHRPRYCGQANHGGRMKRAIAIVGAVAVFFLASGCAAEPAGPVTVDPSPAVASTPAPDPTPEPEPTVAEGAALGPARAWKRPR